MHLGRFYIVFVLLLAGWPAWAGGRPFSHLDLQRILFGVEYTFQDQDMVDEPGRMTFETPHKRERYEALKRAYSEELGVMPEAVIRRRDAEFKPGGNIDVPGDGKHMITMEPVCIEVNTPPRTFDQIEESGEKIFRAAGKARLLPYVRPAAERSGMGHIHVGSIKMGDNPFYRNPNLLRNMLVYLHQHPSLMWGFAEAYDIGPNSNIRTQHGKMEPAFQRAIAKYDEWYARLGTRGETSDGLRQLLKFLKQEGLEEIFYHYGMVNLEHLNWLANRRQPVGPDYVHSKKATVEFRNFRPPKSPRHAKANAELLLSLMDKFAQPGALVPFRRVPSAEYNNFYSASRVRADWEEVKQGLGRRNVLWDEMISEYVDAQVGIEAIKLKLPRNAGAEIYPAYSPKRLKGTKFELRIPSEGDEPPRLAFAGAPLEFEKVEIGQSKFWVTVISLKKGDVPDFISEVNRAAACRRWFSRLR